MTLEKLQALLAAGAISQEEFDELSKGFKPETPPAGAGTTGAAAGAAEPAKPKETPPPPAAEDGLEARIQQMVDRATNRLGNDNKVLKLQLEKERKKNLTVEELKQVELQEKEQELLQKEKEIQEKENRMYAIKALKKFDLDDGGEDSLDYIDFVMAEDETVIDEKVKSLKSLIDRRVKKEVEQTFRENGRDPAKGGSGGGKENPWSKESWNLTKQMELEISSPEAAKVLKAGAGK